jgi:hypothetical protein
MDGALVILVPRATADNNPSLILAKVNPAVVWLKQRIRVQRNDKGGGIVYFTEVEAATRAAEQAASLFRRGDVEAAKPFALEALKHLDG